jgi:hypothetical protein
VVALLTVLAAKRANARTSYPWTLAGLFSAASVAFNIAHAPNRPVARLVFAMAPVALVPTTHLLMQQASWRQHSSQRPPTPVPQFGPQPAQPHSPGGHPAFDPTNANRGGRLAPAHGFWRHTEPGSRPGRRRPVPAWPRRQA